MANLNLSLRWQHAKDVPASRGKIRGNADDFKVDENLSFTPDGTGEHVFLRIEKRNENTDYVAGQLAKFCGVAKRDVGYAGLKDRSARTTQWFSVWLPGRADPDWRTFESENIRVLQSLRNSRKLRIGALTGNSFQIVVRDWQGDREDLQQRLYAIQAEGIPNYFGPQRFGHDGQNVAKALAMFQGRRVKREQRSIYLSAARSYIFNQLLASRIAQQCWNRAVPGDALMLDGAHSFFSCVQPDAEIEQRIQTGKLHPTGILWGRGGIGVSGQALELETEVAGRYPELTSGLEASGVDCDRRALRVNVTDLNWELQSATILRLSFTLPAGSYATALLREIVETEENLLA